MASREPFLAVTDCTLGLNSGPVLTLPERQVPLAENVDWYNTSVARKRTGVTAITSPTMAKIYLLSSGAYDSGVSYGSGNEAEHTWFVYGLATGGSTVEFQYRSPGSGSSWTTMTLVDAGSTTLANLYTAFGVFFNGKWFVTYAESSPSHRLHVYESRNSTKKLYRVGLATPGALTVADTASAGSYPAVLRYYKIAWTMQTAGVTLLRSDYSAVSSFTPSGTKTGALITRPTAPSEGETHWEVYGSADGAIYYLLSTIAIGTTTYTDTALVTTYSNNTVAEDAGTYTQLHNPLVLGVDDNRLLMAGSRADATLASRLWWTPVVGSEGAGDDQRWVNTTAQKNYLDLDPYECGDVTAIGAPLFGTTYVFKQRRIYKLVRTGDVAAPYVPVVVTSSVGCIRQHTVVYGEMQAGEPAIYWLDESGPYRMSSAGLEWLGEALSARWRQFGLQRAHGIYWPMRQQVWWWVYDYGIDTLTETGTAQEPNTVVVYDIRRASWAVYTGGIATSPTSAMHGLVDSSSTYKNSLTTVPHVVSNSGSAVTIGQCYAGTTDFGTAFQASLTTRPLMTQGWMTNLGVTEVEVFGTGRLSVGLVRDLGVETRAEVVDLVPEADEARVWKKVEGVGVADAKMVQVQLQDEYPTPETWQVDAVVLRTRHEGVR